MLYFGNRVVMLRHKLPILLKSSIGSSSDSYTILFGNKSYCHFRLLSFAPFKSLNFNGVSIISWRSYATRRSFARLSPSEVTTVLRGNENSEDIYSSGIKSFETNQLPSNSPVEDSRAEARCLLTTGKLFGIFDGHGGPGCSQVVAKRLFSYIAASLLPPKALEELVRNYPYQECSKLLQSYNDRFDLVEDLQQLYSQNLHEFMKHMVNHSDGEPFSMHSALENAFISLDNDISREARMNKPSREEFYGQSYTQDNRLCVKTLSVALSGAVACVAYVDEDHLHVANCGDCRAVLGTWDSETETWIAEPVTTDHTCENVNEVNRIFSEHPIEERDNVIRNDRLLGQLAPVRAFGDMRFKWTNEEIREFIVPLLGEQVLMPNNLTPPYLTAKPEIFYHKLRPKDHFLILASDGLWDLLSSRQAVRLVGEHMSGKTVLKPFVPPKNKEVDLQTVHRILMERKNAKKLKPIDANVATHLIRYALGGTDSGIDNNKMSHLLTLPEDSVRLFRDDITVTVIFFDTDYLSRRPL